MCRWAAYSGKPVHIEEIVASPRHSLIEQSQAASECKTSVNGDGFGLAWYGDRPEPGLYRDILPAWSDCNLRNIARQVRSPLFLAHVRASTGTPTNRQNCHPFVMGHWAFMHNGQIGGFTHLRRALEEKLSDALYQVRFGSTDSELLFLLALQEGLEEAPARALMKAVETVLETAQRLSVEPLVRLTAALSDGRQLHAVRYSTDAICPTLYVSQETIGEGWCLVSEPLDRQDSRWAAVEPGTFITVSGAEMRCEPFGRQNASSRGKHRQLAESAA
ncbi:class II glutamine amidotransferase [Salaquimonas pukyongi]|uniref:class II glutamine amidotransferase n=1 Tax=Salaquimonas pukyongi TaxID=2712698 RepID=UPI00096B8D0C|nr:class II glutamine amidotransferase [Salaquimonas pukyongi]